MKIYTKTGDKGTTSLIGGKIVYKNSPRVELYGTIDELNSVLSIALQFDAPNELKDEVTKITEELFILGADFATPLDVNINKLVRINNKHIENLENKIDKYYKELTDLKNFINTYTNKFAAFLNNARTICRRAERIAVTVNEQEKLTEDSLKYLNRLSDYLFVLIRYNNHLLNITEKKIIIS